MAVRSGAMFAMFSLPCPLSPSLKFARGRKSVVCILRPAGTHRHTRAAHEGQSHRPYDTQMCTMLTAANTYPPHARVAVLRASPPDKQDLAGEHRKGPEEREHPCTAFLGWGPLQHGQHGTEPAAPRSGRNDGGDAGHHGDKPHEVTLVPIVRHGRR